MTPTGGSADTAAGFWRWNSPVPYLFGGLTAMLFLIAISLFVLAWSYLKTSSSNNDGEDIEKPVKIPHVLPPAEMEPKIVVIMAGDENPRFIAEPMINKLINTSSSASSSSITTDHQHHYNNNNSNQQEEV